jgi:hypothetical protein
LCCDLTRRANGMFIYKIGVVWEAVGSELLTVRGASCAAGVVSRPHGSLPAATKPFSRHSQPSPTTHVKKNLGDVFAYTRWGSCSAFVSNFVLEVGQTPRLRQRNLSIFTSFNQSNRITFAPYRTGAPYPPPPRLSHTFQTRKIPTTTDCKCLRP